MLVGFEQDPHPDAPTGAGYFTADSGERAYAFDPGLASSLSGQQTQPQPFDINPELTAAAQPGEDQRQASNGGFQTTDQRLAGGGPPPAAVDQQLAAMHFQAPQGPAPAAPPPGPAQPPVGGGPPADPAAQQAAAQQAYVNQPMHVTARPGGFNPRTSEESYTDAGLPLDPQQAAELGHLNENVKVAKQAETGLLVARANAQEAAARAALPDLVMKQKEAEARLTQVQDGARQDLQKAKDLIQATNEKKIDPGRMFQGGKGAIAGIFAVAAQAFGAYAAIKSKTGRNFGQEIVQQTIDRDVAAQKEEIDQGRAGANNMLAALQRKYDYTLPQAESALRMAQTGVVQQQLSAFDGAKLSQDAQANLANWQADLEKQQFMEARKLYEAGLGKHSRKVNLQYQAPTAGGMVDPTEAERQKRLGTIKMAQETGTIPDASREGRALDMKAQADAKKEKNNPAVAKAQDQLSSIESSIRSADELDKLYAKPGVLTRAERGRMESLQELAPLEVHKALTGMSRFTETEGQRYATAYGTKGETLDYTGKHRAALGVLREDLARKKAQLQQQLQSGVGSPEGAEGDAIKDVE